MKESNNFVDISYSTRRLITLITIVIVIAFASITYGTVKYGDSNSKSQIEDIADATMYLTAAHLDIEDVEEETGFSYIGKDPELDIAYYINTAVRPVLQYTGAITIEGISECSIDSIMKGYFLVKVVDTTEVYAGLSGVRVCDTEGRNIGFVSELTEDGYLKCMTIIE
jgi:hypothetical protein